MRLIPIHRDTHPGVNAALELCTILADVWPVHCCASRKKNVVRAGWLRHQVSVDDSQDSLFVESRLVQRLSSPRPAIDSANPGSAYIGTESLDENK